MRKKIQVIFLFLFIILLLIPLCLIKTGNNVVSSIDNRELVEFPDFSEKNWKNELESYLADRIGCRSFLINLNTVFNDKVFGKMVHPMYTYGTDGYVFFRMHKNLEYEEFHHQFALMVKKIQEYCEERGIKFYFLFNPEKISVYSRYLPKGVYYNDDWVRQFFNELDLLEVNYVDNSELLKERSYSEQVFNKKFDAGHWNDLGMFYGLNNLFEKMSYDFPDVRKLTFDDFSISNQKMKSLWVSHFAINEDVPVFKKKIEVENLTNCYSKEIPLNNNYHNFVYLKNESDNCGKLPRILLFQGSYLNRNNEFIINNASETISIHNYQNVLDADYYINVFNPDCVVFDMAEYVFYNTYFDFTRMVNLEFQNSYECFKNTVTDFESLALQDELLMAVKKEGEVITTVYLEKTFADVKNAYFFCNFDVFDLQNTKGALYFSFMNSDDEFDYGEVLLEKNDGICYRYPVVIRNKERALNDTYIISSGVEFLDKKEISLGEPVYITSRAEVTGDSYSFKTDVEDNAFNCLVIQQYNPVTDSYKPLSASSSENVLKRSVYHHLGETGEYELIVRANSNKADELVSYKVAFEQDKDYCFDFTVETLTSNKLIVQGLHIYEVGNNVTMETNVKRNIFDNVVIQLYDPYRDEYCSIDASKSNICSKVYSHERQTGDFVINLKCNSNKKDELMSYTVHLENGKNYLYDLMVDSFKRKKVIINDFEFYE